jgi:hypothetical protein
MDKKYFVVAIVGSLPFALWWGVPTYNKAKADAMVDELCAKDGGPKIYEKVVLPASRFDAYGNIQIPFEKKTGSDFYLESESQWIVPYSGESNISIRRLVYKLYRASDQKLLGEAVSYLRRGGDPISPVHPSSYRCPKIVGLERNVFVRD